MRLPGLTSTAAGGVDGDGPDDDDVGFVAGIDSTAPAPRWLWMFVLVGATWMVGFAAAGLVAAEVGWYRWWIAGIGALGLVVVALPTLRRSVPTDAVRHDWVAAAVVVVVAVAGVWSASRPSHHVVTNSDPGSYLTTARWLDRTGRLYVEPDGFQLLDHDIPGDDPVSPAVYLDEGRLEFQFSHGAPVVLAGWFAVGGTRALFGSTAVVGAFALLGVHLALRSVTRSRLLAAGGTVALAVCLPFVFVTRNTYSEVYVLALMAIAIALILRPGPLARAPLLVASAAVGATLLFRIDAQLYVVGLLLLLAGLVLGGQRRGDVAAAVAAVVPFIVVGWIDLWRYSGTYVSDLAAEVRKMWLATGLAGALLAAAVATVSARGPIALRGVGRRAALVAGAGVVAVGLLARYVRPEVQVAIANWSPDSAYARAVEGYQAAAGVALDGRRSYGENTLPMLDWYLGAPLVLMAILGFGVMAYWALRAPHSRWARFAVVVVVGVPLYLWAPNIRPTQPWMSRRYVPLVIPVFVLAAIVAADGLLSVMRKYQRVGAAVAVVLLVGPAAAVTWPLRDQAEQRGFKAGIEAVCAELGTDAALLELDDNPRFTMPARAWCGASATAVRPTQHPEAAETIIAESRAECRPIIVITRQPDALAAYADDLGSSEVYRYVNPNEVLQTIVARPDEYVEQTLEFTLAPVLPGPTCPADGAPADPG